MDISKLSHGAKLVLGGTIAFLIVSFFNWQEVEFADIASVGASMWNGWGWIAGLLAIALLVWEGLRLMNIEVALPVGPAMTSAALAILIAVATFLKFLTDNEYRTFWAWLGLALAIAIAVGAVSNMKAAGEMSQLGELTGRSGGAGSPDAATTSGAGAATAAGGAAAATAPVVDTGAEAGSEVDTGTDAAADAAENTADAGGGADLAASTAETPGDDAAASHDAATAPAETAAESTDVSVDEPDETTSA